MLKRIFKFFKQSKIVITTTPEMCSLLEISPANTQLHLVNTDVINLYDFLPLHIRQLQFQNFDDPIKVLLLKGAFYSTNVFLASKWNCLVHSLIIYECLIMNNVMCNVQ